MAAKDPYAWNLDDAVALRNFIAQNPKFLYQLRRRMPEISGTTMEARAVTGSDANGFIKALKEIDTMQQDLGAGSEDAGFIPEIS